MIADLVDPLVPTQSLSPAKASSDSGWLVVDSADVNGDGIDEIVVSNPFSGNNGIWAVSGGQVTGFIPLPYADPFQWEVVGSADVNGNGVDDILVRGFAGNNGIWAMNNGQVTGFIPLPYTDPSSNGADPNTGWRMFAGADTNGNGTDDIIVVNDNSPFPTGIWTVANAQVTGFVPLPYIAPSSNWQIVGTGDTNGDGTDDIFLNDTSGGNAIWTMSNNQVTGFIMLPDTPEIQGWDIVGSADLNNDNIDDILLSNSNGSNGAWVMFNHTAVGFASLPATP
jgi:hypothetical protein